MKSAPIDAALIRDFQVLQVFGIFKLFTYTKTQFCKNLLLGSKQPGNSKPFIFAKSWLLTGFTNHIIKIHFEN